MDSSLVTPQWVADRMTRPGLKILDASWYMPAMGRNGAAEFKAGRIPGSSYFDIDSICDPSSGLPHMLPTEQGFAAAMDALGVANDTDVVVYDGAGVFSAPRAWWTLRVFGHEYVALLDGGLPAWKAAGLAVDSAPADEVAMAAPRDACRSPPATTRYRARLDRSKVRSYDQMLANVQSKVEAVVDARSLGRFAGTEPEPRPGLRGGHIPGARCVPFPNVLKPGMAGFKAPAEMQAAFEAAGVDPAGTLVGSCGSGLTACILAHAVHQLNGKVIPIYDGSWSEWGGRDDAPVATGPDP